MPRGAPSPHAAGEGGAAPWRAGRGGAPPGWRHGACGGRTPHPWVPLLRVRSSRGASRGERLRDGGEVHGSAREQTSGVPALARAAGRVDGRLRGRGGAGGKLQRRGRRRRGWQAAGVHARESCQLRDHRRRVRSQLYRARRRGPWRSASGVRRAVAWRSRCEWRGQKGRRAEVSDRARLKGRRWRCRQQLRGTPRRRSHTVPGGGGCRGRGAERRGHGGGRGQVGRRAEVSRACRQGRRSRCN